jgi:hypothetical protein
LAGRSGGVTEFQKTVNAMTNHDRNQWARAGYPGLKKKDLSALNDFIARRMQEKGS